MRIKHKAKRKRTDGLPNGITVGGKLYDLTVMQVLDRDQDGRPRRLMMIQDEETVSVAEGAAEGKRVEFILVYVAKSIVAHGVRTVALPDNVGDEPKEEGDAG